MNNQHLFRQALCAAVATLLFAAPLAAQSSDETATQTPKSRRASWVSDRRDYRVGDILTIVIDESTSASDRSNRQGENSRSLGGGASASVPGGVTLEGAGVQTGIESKEREVNEIQRRDHLNTQVSVEVVEVLPSGVLRVKGERLLSLDRHKQVLSVEGSLRAEDVSLSGVAHSSRLANAKIGYRGKKPLIRPGFLGRILQWLWP